MSGMVVLIRGINVGAHHRVRMPELVAACEAAGLGSPRAYLQSGNLVFDAVPAGGPGVGSLADAVAAVLASDFGVEARCMALTAERIAEAVASVPEDAEADEKLTHLVFWDPPGASGAERFDSGRAELLAAAEEGAFGADRLIIEPDHAVVLYRESSRSSKLTLARLERALGVDATARNLRTARALARP